MRERKPEGGRDRKKVRSRGKKGDKKWVKWEGEKQNVKERKARGMKEGRSRERELKKKKNLESG